MGIYIFELSFSLIVIILIIPNSDSHILSLTLDLGTLLGRFSGCNYRIPVAPSEYHTLRVLLLKNFKSISRHYILTDLSIFVLFEICSKSLLILFLLSFP